MPSTDTCRPSSDESLSQLGIVPHLHRTILIRVENCKQCTEQGKNPKPLIRKSQLDQLPSLQEPDQEIQLDFAGPISDTHKAKTDTYIQVAGDRCLQYPSATVHRNGDTPTAPNFLKNYCKFYGITHSIRNDQPQVLKAKSFEIFCRNKNNKLKFPPQTTIGQQKQLNDSYKPLTAA